MKRLSVFYAFFIAYYFFVFAVFRIFFIIYQYPFLPKADNIPQLLQSFLAGYRLDLSTACMFISPVLILGTIYSFWQKNYLKKILTVYTFIVLLVICNICLADAGIYREWNAKINMQALAHFKHPSEVLNTVPTFSIILFILLTSGFTFLFFFLYKKWIYPLFEFPLIFNLKKRIAYNILFFLATVYLSIVSIRGGFSGVPINQGVAFYCSNAFCNAAAINPVYNLVQDMTIVNVMPDESTYKICNNESAKKLIANSFISCKENTASLLNTTRPNLLFIFLESWSADNVASLGGIEGCTPRFDYWSKNGLLFTNAYANAYVSDQGIPAVLSAYPSASRMAVINQANKVANLPCISEELIQEGYTADFIFGGELVYGNLNGYLLSKKFKIHEVDDYPQYPKGKLGIHDNYMFKELLLSLKKLPQPFIQGFFTQSTHMPYDYEKEENLWQSTAEDPEKNYTESVHFSDKYLGAFLDEFSKEKAYKNTLIVIVADHSHNSIKQWNPADAMHHKIPLLFLGGALDTQWIGKKFSPIVSQLDIAKTLLNQMQIDDSRYPWSRNIFCNKFPSDAYYVFFGGVGYINNIGYAATYIQNRPYVHHSDMNDSLFTSMAKKANAFQQLVYENVRLRN